MLRLLIRPLVLAALAAALALASPGSTVRGGSATRLTVLFDTHMHGFVTGPNDVSLANYVGLIKERRAAAPGPTLWLGAGDDLGSSQMSSVFFGQQMIDIFNAGGLDADTMGNHEFDYGPDNFLERARASRFSWLSANVIDRRTGDVFGADAGVRRYMVRDMGGVRVGITGVAWGFLGSSAHGPNVEVLDAATALRTVVPEMRAAGAQVVLVMSHMCVPQAEQVAAAVPGITAILGDHCAVRMREPRMVGSTLIASRGDEYQALGELTVTVEGGAVTAQRYQELEVTKDSPADSAVAAIVADYTGRLVAEFRTVLGETTVALDARNATVRAMESNLGNYLADAMRTWGRADVALQNGGGIRGNREYPAGPLTRGDIVAILPFNNTGVVLRLSGADLRAAVENGVSGVPDAGRFPQVSGMTYAFDPSAPAGSRVYDITVGGAPLDPARMYTVATNNFMADGGDGYEMFKAAERLVTAQAGPLLTDVLAEAVQRDRVIAPRTDGRIRVGR